MNGLRQLSLNLCLRDNATFENFWVGDNRQVVALLQSMCRDSVGETSEAIMTETVRFSAGIPLAYIWGKLGSGRSHLLGACCHELGREGFPVGYFALSDAKKHVPEMLQDLENLTLLCLDDLEAVIGMANWEEAILHCCNRIFDCGGQVLIAANAAPAALSFVYSDLKSRMSSGAIFQIVALDDDQKKAALKWRASLRGLELSDNVVNYLLRYYWRDTESLFAALEELDRKALQSQRRLTIPFVKIALSKFDK